MFVKLKNKLSSSNHETEGASVKSLEYKCKYMDAQQYDGKENAHPFNCPQVHKEEKDRKGTTREMSVDQHTAARSLGTEHQPVSAPWMNSDSPVDKLFSSYSP